MRCFICLACAAIALLVVGSPATGQQAAPAPATTEEPIELKVGDVAPEFEGVDQKGEPFKSIEHVGKRVIVLYFYPKD
ncbi:MAG TPA: hypothetical protein VEQ85_03795, partial [Lacipirellulaceae bacterium]|nr:hypothetical protein [Lacipirellulaceae bacterium]